MARSVALVIAVWLLQPTAVWSWPVNARNSAAGIPLNPNASGYCDMSFQIEFSEDPAILGLEVVVFDPNLNQLGYSWAQDYGWFVANTIQVSFPATGDYECGAHVYYNGDYVGSMSGIIPVYIMAFDVTLNVFIPEPYSIHPLLPLFVYEGDDRTFDKNSDRYRAHLGAGVVGPSADIANHVDSIERATGITTVGVLTPPDWIPWASAQAGTEGINCGAYRLSSNRVQMDCIANVTNPLAPVPPWLDWVVEINTYANLTLDYSQDGVYVLLSMEHDGYPNFELYVGNQSVYAHDHAWWQTPVQLGPPTEVYVPLIFLPIE